MVSAGSSDLGVYDPDFYVQEGLILLENALGAAARVYRGIDTERASLKQFGTAKLRRPAKILEQNAPGTAQGVETDTIDVTLPYWKTTKTTLRDDELTKSEDAIITDHIGPAIYALAQGLDQRLSQFMALNAGNAVPWGTTSALDNIADVRTAMFDAQVPLDDATKLHMMISGQMENQAMKEQAFTQYQGAGNQGVETQMTGHLGRKSGFEIFANQNANGYAIGGNTYLQHGSHADNVGAINNVANYAKGAASFVVDGFTGSETIKQWEPIKFVLDDGSEWYTTVLADVAFTTGAGTITTTDALPSAMADNAVITLLGTGASKPVENGVAFHRNFVALATAPLSDLPKRMGFTDARIGIAVDPKSGLSLRSRFYYMPDLSEVHVAFDILYGFATMDSMLGTKMERDVS